MASVVVTEGRGGASTICPKATIDLAPFYLLVVDPHGVVLSMASVNKLPAGTLCDLAASGP